LASAESSDQDVEAGQGKAMSIFWAMDTVESKIIGRAAKVKIFNSNVQAVVLYAS